MFLIRPSWHLLRPDLSARFDTLKMASTQDQLLEGTFYVKEIQKERTRKRRKQMLVSWEGFDEKHNT